MTTAAKKWRSFAPSRRGHNYWCSRQWTEQKWKRMLPEFDVRHELFHFLFFVIVCVADKRVFSLPFPRTYVFPSAPSSQANHNLVLCTRKCGTLWNLFYNENLHITNYSGFPLISLYPGLTVLQYSQIKCVEINLGQHRNYRLVDTDSFFPGIVELKHSSISLRKLFIEISMLDWKLTKYNSRVIFKCCTCKDLFRKQ